MTRLVPLVLFAACGRTGFDPLAVDAPEGGPSLDQALVSDLGGFVLTRASRGTYLDGAGVMQLAEANAPRFDHDPASLKPTGLLLEGPTTNRMVRSQTLDNTGIWLANGAMSAIADTGLAPDGTQTADSLLDEDMAGNARRFQGTGNIVTTVLPYVFSAFVHAGSLERATFSGELLGGTPQRQVSMDVDLMNAVVVTPPNTSLTTGWGVQKYPNGWCRVWIHLDNDGGNTEALLSLWSDYLAVPATGSYLAWGAQVEMVPLMSSYVPTVAAIEQRAAELASASIDWPAEGGTLRVTADVIGDAGATQTAVCLDGVVPLCIWRDTSTGRVQADIAGQRLTGGTWTIGTPHTFVIAWTSTNVTLWDSQSKAPVTREIDVRSFQALNLSAIDEPLFGHVSRVTYWNERLPDVELDALSR